MKSVKSLVLLSVISSLFLTSCGQDWSWSGGGYKPVKLGGTYYGSNFNGAPSFGGHGGGYGNGYSIWPQPTLNYGEYYTYDDDTTLVGNSWDHGNPAVPPPMATRPASSKASYDSGPASGK